MSDELSNFVHKAVFIRQVRKIDDIHRQARKKGINVSRNEVYRVVEDVCTPYKRNK